MNQPSHEWFSCGLCSHSLTLSLCTQTHPLPRTAKWLATMLPWWSGLFLLSGMSATYRKSAAALMRLMRIPVCCLRHLDDKRKQRRQCLCRTSQSAGRPGSGRSASSSDPQPSSQLTAGMCFVNESQCCCNLGLRAVWVFLIHSAADRSGDSHVTAESVAPPSHPAPVRGHNHWAWRKAGAHVGVGGAKGGESHVKITSIKSWHNWGLNSSSAWRHFQAEKA